MLRYTVKRFISLIVVLWAMTVVMFALIHSIPGDPLAGAMGLDTSREVIERLREQMGLNLSLVQQYINYLSNLARGDFGISFISRRPVSEEIAQYFSASAELILFALTFAVSLGILFGILAAVYWRRWPDEVIRFVSLLGSAAPLFWVALIFQLVFFRYLGWLPVDSRIDFAVGSPTRITGLFLVDSLLTRDLEAFWSSLRHLLLPGLALGLNTLGLLVRQTRASVLEQLQRDFIRTARAKGLPERLVLYRHTLKNAAIPIVTEIGLQFGITLGSAFLVEIVFSWPGMGLYAVRAILNLDYPAILGVAQLFTLVYVVSNFLVDLSYPLLDPRIVYGDHE